MLTAGNDREEEEKKSDSLCRADKVDKPDTTFDKAITCLSSKVSWSY